MGKNPIVSVIVPVYNRVQYLEQSINSILKQDYTDFEVIIIDDGSTEDIMGTVTKCINQAPSQIRFIRQVNKGPAGARNKGIKEAAAKYIAFLDADDEWAQGFLGKGMAQLLSGQYQWMDAAYTRLILNDKEEIIEKKIINSGPIEGMEDLYGLLLKRDVIGNPSKVIVLKECFEKVGCFREDLRIREDWEMWLRLAKAGFKFHRLFEPLSLYKIRQNSLTRAESLKGLRCTYKLLSEYAGDAFKSDAANHVLYAEMMWDIARGVLSNKEKDVPLFLKSVLKSQLYDPNINRVLKSVSSLKKRYG